MPFVHTDYKLKNAFVCEAGDDSRKFDHESYEHDLQAVLLADFSVPIKGAIHVSTQELDHCTVGDSTSAGKMVKITVNFMDGKRTPEQESAMLRNLFDAAVKNLQDHGFKIRIPGETDSSAVPVTIIKQTFPQDGMITSIAPGAVRS